ncbi:MAG: J domain-containing protein [Planctomycetia bacterium]|nr:J domain-containing protein [Planctomycetia bacterium]
MNDVTPHAWPDSLDASMLTAFLAVAIALPALGYFFLVIDVRRYLRSLRRAIATIVYRDTGTPDWARPLGPRCVTVFGLPWPCSEEELLVAYRQKIKSLHPDHGGDERRFLLLQGYFEEALRMIRKQEETAAGAAGGRQ